MQADLAHPEPTAATSQPESNGINAGCWALLPNNGKITAVLFSGVAWVSQVQVRVLSWHPLSGKGPGTACISWLCPR